MKDADCHSLPPIFPRDKGARRPHRGWQARGAGVVVKPIAFHAATSDTIPPRWGFEVQTKVTERRQSGLQGQVRCATPIRSVPSREDRDSREILQRGVRPLFRGTCATRRVVRGCQERATSVLPSQACRRRGEEAEETGRAKPWLIQPANVASTPAKPPFASQGCDGKFCRRQRAEAPEEKKERGTCVVFS